VPTRRNKAYALLAVLLLSIGALLFLNDAVDSAWATGFPANREAYLRRFYWDLSCLGLICAIAVVWCFRIWLKRHRIN
jgi:hypothetical protein